MAEANLRITKKHLHTTKKHLHNNIVDLQTQVGDLSTKTWELKHHILIRNDRIHTLEQNSIVMLRSQAERNETRDQLAKAQQVIQDNERDIERLTAQLQDDERQQTNAMNQELRLEELNRMYREQVTTNKQQQEEIVQLNAKVKKLKKKNNDNTQHQNFLAYGHLDTIKTLQLRVNELQRNIKTMGQHVEDEKKHSAQLTADRIQFKKTVEATNGLYYKKYLDTKEINNSLRDSLDQARATIQQLNQNISTMVNHPGAALNQAYI